MNQCEKCSNYTVITPPSFGECRLTKKSVLYNDTCEKFECLNDVWDTLTNIFNPKNKESK